MTRTTVHANSAPKAIGPDSHATVVRGDLLIASGQTPIDPATGQLVPGEIDAQTRQVLANVAAVLDAAGLTLDKRRESERLPDRHGPFRSYEPRLRRRLLPSLPSPNHRCGRRSSAWRARRN